MKFVYGLSAALLGTTLLAGVAAAQDNNPPRHPHFSARGHEDLVTTTARPTGGPQNYTPQGHPQANFNANTKPNANANATFSAQNNHWTRNPNWSRNHNGGGRPNNAPHPHWNANNLQDHNVSHFSAQDRSTWQHGRWQHGRHHGRDGWWWYSGGNYFFYDQPVYPYPGYVSNYYYDDDYYDDGGYDGYADPGYGAAPGDGGYYWYYCSNPAGYYPYVKSCRGPWRAVTPTPQDSQQGYDNGPDGSDDDQGPPPGYDNNGPQGSDQYNGPDDQGPGYDGGPPPGYDNNADDDGSPPPPR